MFKDMENIKEWYQQINQRKNLECYMVIAKILKPEDMNDIQFTKHSVRWKTRIQACQSPEMETTIYALNQGNIFLTVPKQEAKAFEARVREVIVRSEGKEIISTDIFRLDEEALVNMGQMLAKNKE